MFALLSIPFSPAGDSRWVTKKHNWGRTIGIGSWLSQIYPGIRGGYAGAEHEWCCALPQVQVHWMCTPAEWWHEPLGIWVAQWCGTSQLVPKLFPAWEHTRRKIVLAQMVAQLIGSCSNFYFTLSPALWSPCSSGYHPSVQTISTPLTSAHLPRTQWWPTLPYQWFQEVAPQLQRIGCMA